MACLFAFCGLQKHFATFLIPQGHAFNTVNPQCQTHSVEKFVTTDYKSVQIPDQEIFTAEAAENW